MGSAGSGRPRRSDVRGTVFRAIDARLGVEGLPQSGTGQAALFTGVNAPRLAGRHYGPYPHSKTRPALTADNVFSRILRLGLAARSAGRVRQRLPAALFRVCAPARPLDGHHALLPGSGRPYPQPETELADRTHALTADFTGPEPGASGSGWTSG